MEQIKIKVLLADDHLLVRAGIKSLLQGISNVEVVGEADNGRETLRMVEECKPDLVLLDIAMSELNGLEVTERVSKDHPDVLIVILSMHMNEEYVLQALRTGAAGYLLKDSAPTELEIAINAVMRGERYLSPAISKNLVDDYLRRINGDYKKPDKESVFELLTPRQREILQLIAEGNSTKEIAEKLHVSVKTVETHRAQLMERLDIRDVAGLVRYAIRTGLIEFER
jgi:DNA-binding NarL/FixJ family response regulator